ncbi:hypothetical protein PspLS_06045, partial [Pyricularia sp. CBS 133598]
TWNTGGTSPLTPPPRSCILGPSRSAQGSGQGWGAYPCLSVTGTTGKTPFKHTESPGPARPQYRIVDR